MGANIGAGDSAVLLVKVGESGDQTNVVANIIHSGEDYSLQEWSTDQAIYDEKITDGALGVGQMAMSMVWCSEFISTGDNKRICPCELVLSNPYVEFDDPAEAVSYTHLRAHET